MSRTGLTDVRGMTDVHQVWNFDLFVDNVPGGGDGRGLTVRCKTTAMPGMQIDQVTVGLHGVEVNYKGRQIYSKTFQATFVETRDLIVTKAIRQWIEFGRNNRENSGNYKADYEARARLVLYDDLPNQIREMVLIGMFPIDLNEVNLDGSQSAATEITVTFSYDYHEYN